MERHSGHVLNMYSQNGGLRTKVRMKVTTGVCAIKFQLFEHAVVDLLERHRKEPWRLEDWVKEGGSYL